MNKCLAKNYAAMAVCLGLALSAQNTFAATVLSYSPWLPPAHALNDAVRPWMKSVEEVTEGRVKVEMRAASVGAPREQFDVVRDGLVDLSVVSLGYSPGRFPLQSMGELPFLSEHMTIAAPAFDRLYRQQFEQFDSFPGTHVLSIYTTLPAHVFTNKRLIKSVGDFKGLKLRSSNPTSADMLDSLGAVPVQKSASEFYELISSGIIDGALSEPQTVVNFNVENYLKYVTVVPGGLGQSVMALVINERKWNTISEEDRKAIMTVSGEAFASAAAHAFTDFNAVAIEKMEQVGVTKEVMNDELTNTIKAQLKGIDESWFAQAKKAGLSDPEAVLRAFREELRTAEQPTKDE